MAPWVAPARIEAAVKFLREWQFWGVCEGCQNGREGSSSRGFGATSLVPEVELGIREQGEAELARDERASLHSITSSARASSVAGIVRPRIFAAVKLMTSSNWVANSIGRSPALVPFKILSTKPATRRQFARQSIP